MHLCWWCMERETNGWIWHSDMRHYIFWAHLHDLCVIEKRYFPTNLTIMNNNLLFILPFECLTSWRFHKKDTLWFLWVFLQETFWQIKSPAIDLMLRQHRVSLNNWFFFFNNIMIKLFSFFTALNVSAFSVKMINEAVKLLCNNRGWWPC